MSKYNVCVWCGAHLDHGEKCECRQVARITYPVQQPKPIRRSENAKVRRVS